MDGKRVRRRYDLQVKLDAVDLVIRQGRAALRIALGGAVVLSGLLPLKEGRAQSLPSVRLPLQQKFDTTLAFRGNNGEFSGSYRLVGHTDSTYNIFLSRQEFSRDVQSHTSLLRDADNQTAPFGSKADPNSEVFTVRELSVDTIKLIAVDTMAKYRYMTLVNGQPLTGIYENDSSMTQYTGEKGWEVSWSKPTVMVQSTDTVRSTTIKFVMEYDTARKVQYYDTLDVAPLRQVRARNSPGDDFRMDIFSYGPQKKVHIADYVSNPYPLKFHYADTTLPAAFVAQVYYGDTSKVQVTTLDMSNPLYSGGTGLPVSPNRLIYEMRFDNTLLGHLWFNSDGMRAVNGTLVTWNNDSAYHQGWPSINLNLPNGAHSYFILDAKSWQSKTLTFEIEAKDSRGHIYPIHPYWYLYKSIYDTNMYYVGNPVLIANNDSGDSVINGTGAPTFKDGNGFTIRTYPPNMISVTLGEHVGIDYVGSAKYPTAKPTHPYIESLNLLAPAADTIFVDPKTVTFSWKKAETQYDYPGEPKPVQYRFRLSTDLSGMSNPAVDTSLAGTSVSMAKLPDINSRGYWWVDASTGPQSETRGFTVQTSGVNETVEPTIPGLRAFPNPAGDWVNFRIHRLGMVDVRDALGRVVSTQYLPVDKAVELKGLPPGMYMLNIRGQQESVRVIHTE